MFNKELADKIDAFIKEKFPVIYDYKFDGIVFLRGGTIRNLTMGIPVKDLDFLILSQEKMLIIDFIRKFKLKYRRNAGGGYKISYNNFSIDMFSFDDLYDAACYDVDLFLYDIEKHLFISFGAINALEKRVITEVKNPTPMSNVSLRLNKLINFVKYVTKSEKKVKVKQNILLFALRLCKKNMENKLYKIIDNNYKKCFKYFNNCKKDLIFMILFEIIRTLICLIIPFIIGNIFINIIQEEYNIIFLFVTLICLAFCLKFMFNVVSKCKLKLEKKLTFNMSGDLASCILNYQFDNVSISDPEIFTNSLKNDPNEIAKAFNNITSLLVNFFCNFGLLLYIYYLNYTLGLILSIFMIIIYKTLRRSMKEKNRFIRKYIFEINCFAGSFGELLNYKNKRRISKSNWLKVKSEKNNLLIQWILFIILFLFSLVLLKNNSLKYLSFIIILMYSFKFFTYGTGVNKLLYNLSTLNLSCCRVFNVVNSTSYIREVFGNKYDDKCNGIIEFDSVKFKYNGKTDYVIDECSFRVKSNEAVALVGNSVAGKTTILNLIARLYNVDDGILKIDGVDINEYSEEFIRENVSVISQNPYLFNMSIKDNLRLVKDDITDSEIEEVCKLVCIDEFINTLPKKYDTIIGEGGVKLSGVQKQRLALARALIKNTKIILLDDVIYDDKDSYIVMKKIIKKIAKRHTIIVATDDDNLIKVCDRSLMYEDGKVVNI